MKRLTSMLVVLLTAAPLAAGAGEYLVLDWVQRGRSWAELQGPYRAEETLREGLALLHREFGDGVWWGIYAVGGGCAQRFSGEEFAGYMRGTARPSDRFEDAVRAFLTARRCEVRGGGTVEALLALLTRLRTATDREFLEVFVHTARTYPTDKSAAVAGLVAGARLLELEMQGTQPPAWRPPESGAR